MTVSAEQAPPEDDIPAEDEIQELRQEIDRLDAEILRLVVRRSEVSQRIGRARMAAGGLESGADGSRRLAVKWSRLR